MEKSITVLSDITTNNLGWFVAIILFLLLILRDVAKELSIKLLKYIFKKVLNLISYYWYLSGPVLYNYRKSLLKITDELVFKFFPEKNLILSKIFIIPYLHQNNVDKNYKPFKAIKEFERILILGSPGSGKSALLRYFANKYSRKSHEFDELNRIPILIELREYNFLGNNFKDLLINHISKLNFKNPSQFLAKGVSRNKLLFLLDGFDEVKPSLKEKLVFELVEYFKSNESKFVITTRPSIYADDFYELKPTKLILEEFDDQQIEKFINIWKHDFPLHKSASQLIVILRERPKIMAIARNPLMLTIITFLYSRNDFALPHSRTEFYDLALDIMLDWKHEFNKYKPLIKRLTLKHLALRSFQTTTYTDRDSITISRNSLNQFMKEILPDINLSIAETSDLISEIVNRSGLLIELDDGFNYKFAHLTLQEFLIADALKNDCVSIIQMFNLNSIYVKEIIKLWCGLDHDSTDLIMNICKYDSTLALEFLSDALQVNSIFANQLIDEFKSLLFNDNERQENIHRSFAAIAADPRARGEEIYEYLISLFYKTQNEKNRLQIAKILAWTNLPKAADFLGIHIIEYPELSQSLSKMGDLAIVPIKKLVDSGNAEYIDLFIKISTREAIRTIIYYLWDENSNINLKSAWTLLNILDKNIVLEVLDEAEFDSNMILENKYKWLIEPFISIINNNYLIVLTRCALLIDNSDKFYSKLDDFFYDPKIITPLCTVNNLETQIINNTYWKLINEGSKQNDEIEIEELLSSKSLSSKWKSLFHGLAQQTKINLLSRLIIGPMPTIENWKNIFVSPVKNIVSEPKNTDENTELYMLITFYFLFMISVIIKLALLSFKPLFTSSATLLGFILSVLFVIILILTITRTLNSTKIKFIIYFYSFFWGVLVYCFTVIHSLSGGYILFSIAFFFIPILLVRIIIYNWIDSNILYGFFDKDFIISTNSSRKKELEKIIKRIRES